METIPSLGAASHALLFVLIFGCSQALRPQNSLDQLGDVAVVQKSQNQIFYIVRTCEQKRHDTIPSILDTWAGPVKDSLLMVSEQAVEEPKIYAAEGCASDHEMGLICKTGHAFALAAKMIGDHSWAMLLDDDVYVNTSNLEKELQKHDASQLVALGIPGCGVPHCSDHKGGFCGGGGYAISKPALMAFVDKLDPRQFGAEMLGLKKKFLPNDYPYDDVLSTCLMKERGVKVEDMKGLYGWRLEKGENKAAPFEKVVSSEYKFAIHEDEIPPLTFHYIKPAEMYVLHEEFKAMRSNVKGSLLEAGRTEGSRYDSQKEQFVKMRNAMLA